MRVLVTGGSGFIGSHGVDKLREGNIDVRIYDMIYPTVREDIEFYKGSLLDMESLRMACSKVDYIMHLAAVADVNDVYADPLYAVNLNATGTANVLEAARINGNVKRVVYASTIWVYSDTEALNGGVLTEENPITFPSHLYTSTKLAGEYFCRSYHALYNLPYTIVRFGIPYGPGARARTVATVFIEKALSNEPLTVAGDGKQFRKFVYVEDLAEGLVRALHPKAENKVYNLEGDEAVTVLRVAELVKELLRSESEIVFTEGRPGDFVGKEISNHRAKEELGWYPKTKYIDGLRKYIEWYLSERKAEEEVFERIELEWLKE